MYGEVNSFVKLGNEETIVEKSVESVDKSAFFSG